MAPENSAESLHIELVAADRVVWSGEASEISARTVDGDLGVLRGHTPLLSLLAPGIVTITSVDGAAPLKAAVSDGFLSVANDRVSVLSEEIWLADELNKADVASELEQAQQSGDEQAVQRAEVKSQLVG